jgi:hypothetical protein
VKLYMDMILKHNLISLRNNTEMSIFGLSKWRVTCELYDDAGATRL